MNNALLTENSLQIVTLKVGSEEFGLEIMKVQEIIRFVEAVKVPKAADYVDGVINLRGKIVPIIDLRKRMGKAAMPNSDATRIIVVDTGEKLAGLVVDAVIDVITLNNNEVKACPSIHDNARSDYIMGVSSQNDRLITVLNLECLIN